MPQPKPGAVDNLYLSTNDIQNTEGDWGFFFGDHFRGSHLAHVPIGPDLQFSLVFYNLGNTIYHILRVPWQASLATTASRTSWLWWVWQTWERQWTYEILRRARFHSRNTHSSKDIQCLHSQQCARIRCVIDFKAGLHFVGQPGRHWWNIQDQNQRKWRKSYDRFGWPFTDWYIQAKLSVSTSGCHSELWNYEVDIETLKQTLRNIARVGNFFHQNDWEKSSKRFKSWLVGEG